MKTPYSYITKEQRLQLKAMPDMTGGKFNRYFDNYHRRLVTAMSDDHELDNLKFQLSYTPVPFSEQMIDDFVAIMMYVEKAIRKEKKKDEIQAAAKGMISFEDVRNQFKIIAEFRKIGARKVKVALWRDFDLTQQHNTSNYVWGHWEMIEYKEYYTLDEIKDVCIKIINYNIDWAKKRLAAAEVGLKVFENVGSVDEEKYEI